MVLDGVGIDRGIKLPLGLGEWEMTCALSGGVSGIAVSGER